MWRVAVLHHGPQTNPALSQLRDSLRRRGMIDGDHCIIDAAGADGRLDRLPRLVEELLGRGPDVVATIGGVAALVAQRATATIPVLHATVLDPEDIGLTARNVAGITTFDPDHGLRQLRLLKELVPGLRTVACLVDKDAPRNAVGINPLLAHLQRAALHEGLRVRCLAMHEIPADIALASDTLRQAGAQALVALEVPAVLARLGEIAQIAVRCRLATVFPPGQSDPGVAMLGPSLRDAIDPLAGYICAIARGVAVASLPTRRVRHDRLVVDLGRARRIGLAVPASLLRRAARVIADDPQVSRVALSDEG